MALAESFFAPSELRLFEEFTQRGYVIREVADREALDELRAHVARLAAEQLGREMPNDAMKFLDQIHELVPFERLNELRLSIYHAINRTTWLRPTYHRLGRALLESLVGNELAMQNRVNLSIQMPDDDSSLLDIHADVFGGETPFQVVQWLPLVDCHETKSMFILPHERTKQILPELPRLGERGMGALFDLVEKDLVWLDVPYGEVLVFTPNCLHGNVVNRQPTTRGSMNCRFTGLFTPYGGAEKSIGSYYLPITTRPVSRIGMDYRAPDGFGE